MARVPLYMNDVNGWERVNVAVSANPEDLSHLMDHNNELGAKAAHMKVLSAEQAMLTARRQAVTAEMQALYREGQTLLDYVQTGVRQHYGLSNEKLVEFGLRPTRRRAQAPQPEPPPAPETTAPDPVQ